MITWSCSYHSSILPVLACCLFFSHRSSDVNYHQRGIWFCSSQTLLHLSPFQDITCTSVFSKRKLSLFWDVILFFSFSVPPPHYPTSNTGGRDWRSQWLVQKTTIPGWTSLPHILSQSVWSLLPYSITISMIFFCHILSQSVWSLLSYSITISMVIIIMTIFHHADSREM